MNMTHRLLGLMASLGCLLAAPVSADDDPLVLRRQTLIVRDIERSLALYRDAIGMEVFYDEVIRRPRGEGQPDQEIRLIFLKATDTYIGVLGLVDFQYDDRGHPDHSKPIRREGMTPGNAVVLFNTTELEARWPRIVATPGVEVMRGPTLREYPGYAGQPPIRVMVTLFYDPDGFIVEFNQPLDPIRPQPADGPSVDLPQGRLLGVQREGLQAYYNIPYAAPPVGHLRWRPPQPPDPWAGVRDATRPGAACAQEQGRRETPFPGGTSEDCLYLNVFVPEGDAPPGGWPVMAWIHGGSFRWGSATDPAYDGAAWARDGVLLVTLNYRLDRLGRFAHPALSRSQSDEPLGNYGLMDQVAALGWIRDNVASFGGDPGRVTVFGCSAGGVSVDFLMAMPAARGLFNAAIAQSGSLVPEGERRLESRVGRFPSLEQDGLDVAAYFGIADDEDAARNLRALSAEQLLAYPQKDFSMQPVVDGRLVIDDPARIFAAGGQAAVPMMSGYATWEASLIQPYNLPLPAILGGLDRAEVDKAYVIQDEARLKDVFFGDSLFLSTADFVTASAAAVGQAGFLYEYAYVDASQRATLPGAYHCSETPKLFGMTWRGESATAEDRAMGDRLRRYWIEFAKAGRPAPDWPVNSASAPALMRLDSDETVVTNPHPSRLALHRARYAAVGESPSR